MVNHIQEPGTYFTISLRGRRLFKVEKQLWKYMFWDFYGNRQDFHNSLMSEGVASSTYHRIVYLCCSHIIFNVYFSVTSSICSWLTLHWGHHWRGITGWQGIVWFPKQCSLNRFFFLSLHIIQLRLLASSVKVRHSGLPISICAYILHLPPSLQPLPCPLSSHPWTSFYAFPVSSLQAASFSASFSQYTHHHVQNTSVLPLVFSLQTVPPALSLDLMKIVASSTFSSSSPT